MLGPMSSLAGSYEELRSRFRWEVPEHYNIGVDVCDRHARGDGRLALLFVDEGGSSAQRFSFDRLKALSNRFANVVTAAGLVRGSRLGILLPQVPETAVAHVGAFKAGLVTVPLFTLFGEEALEFRLRDSGAQALVTDEPGFEKVRAIRDRLPELRLVYVTGAGAGEGSIRLDTALERASDAFAPVPTRADEAAVLIYTSGTTGNPKGALHAHRVLLGHLPGVEMPHRFFPRSGDLFWTPADWAWIGGLFDVLLPSWHHGVPVLAHRARKFEPDAAARLVVEHGVRNVFFPPTALKLMRRANLAPMPGKLRSIGSGGETLGEELLEWGREIFGVTIDEFYGQTECNLVVSNNDMLFPVRPGSMGRAVPGHDVRVVDRDGREVVRGEVGVIAVRRPDPVMFLGYWNDPGATSAKFAGDLLLTGDLARQDEEGHFWFLGRDDDLITSAGYRIGPAEIENCMLRHPAVAMVAVVGVPDPVRTAVVKAWVVLKPGHEPSDAVARELQEFVRTRLAAHEYPRLVSFTDALPMTATGKIIRRELRKLR